MKIDVKMEKATLKGLSAITGNLSAGYFGAIFIIPTLIKLKFLSDILLGSMSKVVVVIEW